MSLRARPGGFTLAEILVALVFLSLVAVSFATATHYAGRVVNRSRQELAATHFLQAEAERLRLLPYGALADGSRADGRGIARWWVQDSTTFRQILLETRYGSPARGLLVDSVTILRSR